MIINKKYNKHEIIFHSVSQSTVTYSVLWLNDRASDSQWKGREFEPNQRSGIFVPLGKVPNEYMFGHVCKAVTT